MRHAILDFLHSIRKSPFLFLFIFLQIVISTLITYIVVANYYWTEEESNVAQISWSDKEYGKMMLDSINLPHEITMPLTFSNLTILSSTESDYERNLELFRKIDAFYREASDIEGLDIIATQDNLDLYLTEAKNWEKEDLKYGPHNMFVSENNQPFNLVNILFIGKDFTDYFNVKLSEGSYFNKEDYLYNGDFIPVLMGESYRKYYNLGEEFTAIAGWAKEATFKVTGFIAQNQYYSTAGLSGIGNQVFSFDNIILVPYAELSLDDILEHHPNCLQLFTTRMEYSYYVIEQNKYDTVISQLQDILKKNGLDEYYSFFKMRLMKELASNFKDQLAISIAVCIATLLFSLFSFIFTMLYKIDDNMKNYAIRMVVGETYGGISFRYIFESFTVFLLGQITGFFAFKIYAVNSYIYQGYDYLEVPTLKTGIILNIVFYIITAIILYISVNVKLKTYSLATLISGNEVKKEKRMPFYRVVIFLMLAIVGIFSMFIASYQVAEDRIDIYYTGYYTKNVKIAYVSTLAQENAPKVKVDVDEIGAKAENAIINRYITSKYKGDDYITERGIYFNGYIDPVNMLEGRFFTKEEVAVKEKIAVVGKEIYNKYVTIADDGTAYYHSEDLEADLKVIGVMGKEEQATNLDFIVFVPIKTATAKFGSQANYTLDGKDKETVENLEKVFTEHVSKTAMVSTRKYNPRITVEAPTDMLIMLLIIIIINAVVFCFYYVSKQGHIHAVKKIVGYSKLMILADTFTDFLLLTVGAFVTGNAIVILLKETIFKEVQLFSIYMLDPQVIIISLVAVVALTVLLSVIAIARTFTSGKTNEYRV